MIALVICWLTWAALIAMLAYWRRSWIEVLLLPLVLSGIIWLLLKLWQPLGLWFSILVHGGLVGRLAYAAVVDQRPGDQWRRPRQYEKISLSIDRTDGPSARKFHERFERAGMTLEDVENELTIPGQKGPYPEVYRAAVFDRLFEATMGLSGDEYAAAFRTELANIRSESSTSGTALNRNGRAIAKSMEVEEHGHDGFTRCVPRALNKILTKTP